MYLAKAYWDFHKKICGNVPITFYLVDKNTVDSQSGTLMTQLWFRGAGVVDRSGFDGWGLVGDDEGLDCGNVARGICSPREEEFEYRYG